MLRPCTSTVLMKMNWRTPAIAAQRVGCSVPAMLMLRIELDRVLLPLVMHVRGDCVDAFECGLPMGFRNGRFDHDLVDAPLPG